MHCTGMHDLDFGGESKASLGEIYLLSTDLPKRTKGTWYIHLLPLVLSEDFSNSATLSAVVPFSIVLTNWASCAAYLNFFSFPNIPYGFSFVCSCNSKATNDYASSIPFGREHLHYVGVPFSFTFLASFLFFYSSSEKGLISSVYEFYCLDFSVSSSWVLQLLFMPYAFLYFCKHLWWSQQPKPNFRELKLLVQAAPQVVLNQYLTT
jgi:hypothetical protein